MSTRSVAVMVIVVGVSVATLFGQQGVTEQVLVQTIGLPNWTPTGSRIRLIVPSQTTSRGLIAGSQFYDAVCGTYTFQFGYQVQPSTGPAPTAFAYVFPNGLFSVGPVVSQAEHTFDVTGTGNVWTFSVDGVPFFSFDAGCAALPAPFHALDAYEQILSGTNHPIKLKDLVVTQAFSFLVDGQWIDAGAGVGYRDGFTCSEGGVCSFDARGAAQDVSLTANQIVFSRLNPFNQNIFQLW